MTGYNGTADGWSVFFLPAQLINSDATDGRHCTNNSVHMSLVRNLLIDLITATVWLYRRCDIPSAQRETRQASVRGQRRRKEVWDGGGKTTGGLGDGSPPAGSRGRAPARGLKDEVPRSWRIFKVVTNKFYAFLVVSHALSPIYAYVFLACRHHSTKSAKWGRAFGTVCHPLVCKWGQLPPMLPGSAADLNIILTFKPDH